VDIDQLRTFLAVLEHGSFSRAAEILRVGQSTVSFHIKALESAAGARLLDRGPTGARATAAGATVRRYAQRILALRTEALEQVRAEEAGEMGRLVIAASSVPGELLLPRLVARFLAAHPRVSVTVAISDSRRAIASLLAQECDLCFVGAASRDKRIVLRGFADDEVVLVGRSDRASTRMSAEELAHTRIIVREHGSGTRTAAARVLAKIAERGDVPLLEVSSSQAAKRCALEGAGLALLSRLVVADELARSELVAVPFPGLPVRRRFLMGRLRSVTLSPAARSFASLSECHRHYR
jgi:DNA-binding transcriptional LysR family regulator